MQENPNVHEETKV